MQLYKHKGCPSVCPSVRPSVRHKLVSGWYLPSPCTEFHQIHRNNAIWVKEDTYWFWPLLHKSMVKVTAAIFVPFSHLKWGFWMISPQVLQKCSPNSHEWCTIGQGRHLSILTFISQRSRSQRSFLYHFRTRTWVSGWYLRSPFIDFHQIHRNDASWTKEDTCWFWPL